MSQGLQVTTTDAIVERLERLTVLLELALRPQLEQARRQIRSDEVDAAIFDSADGAWTPAAKLQHEVAAATGKKERSIQGHVGDLVEKGFLLRRGGGKNVEYRSSEVI
jgi:hypothetical protein